MGCGASKSPESVVTLPQAKESEKCSQLSTAAPSLPDGPVASRIDSGKKGDVVMRDVTGSKTGDGGDGVASLANDTKPATEELLKKPPSLKTLNLLVIAEPHCVEQDAMPERPASAESENPARAAFRARFDARSPEDLPPSPVAFRSMRSLNRSIGVRRRTSDQGLQQQQQQQDPAPEPELGPAQGPSDDLQYDYPLDVEEEDDKEPDPLREQFELAKEKNPVLVVGRKPTGTSILSCKASEKSIKSHKRLAFALQGAGGDDAGPDRPVSASMSAGTAAAKSDSASHPEGQAGDLDSDDNMEADRVASVVSGPRTSSRHGWS